MRPSTTSNMSNKEAGKAVMQAAGHESTLKRDNQHAGFILKPFDDVEADNYDTLWGTKHEPLQQFIPRWGGIEKRRIGTKSSGSMRDFMLLGDLLMRFKSPCVMDCKLGVRTFVEEEVCRTDPRPDLYIKLLKYQPAEVTEEERRLQAITKYRWMTIRDTKSTTRKLGFRVDGVVSAEGARVAKEQLEVLNARADVLPVLVRLLPPRGTADDAVQRTLVEQLISQLELLREKLTASTFFKTHEFVGTSLLFVVDVNQAAVHLIDFAKTTPLPPGVTVDHRSPWECGNHEDGVLFGLDNLIDCWVEILSGLEDTAGTGMDRLRSPSSFDDSLFQQHLSFIRKVLTTYGVDADCFGQGSAKSLDELYFEIYVEKAVSLQVMDSCGMMHRIVDSEMQRNRADKAGKLYRVMEVVRAWVLADTSDGRIVLMEPKHHAPKLPVHRLSISRELSRDCLTGGGPEKPIQKKLQGSETWEQTLLSAMEGRLGISAECFRNNFHMQMDTYRTHVDEKSGSDDHSFPGLWSMFRVHELDVIVKDPEAPALETIGLPEGFDCETIEHDPHSAAFGCRHHIWRWRPIRDTDYVCYDGRSRPRGNSTGQECCCLGFVVRFWRHGR